MSKSNRNHPQNNNANRQGKKRNGAANQPLGTDQLADGLAPSDDLQSSMTSGFVNYEQETIENSGATPDFSAWELPQIVQEQNLFSEEAILGAEMQQGGVPLFTQNAQPFDLSFMQQSDDAPTRIGRPVTPQMVNKRTTVERSAKRAPEKLQPAKAPASEVAQALGSQVEAAQPALASKEEALVQADSSPRRRRRMDRNRDVEVDSAVQAQEVAAATDFDLFGAGDSEVQSFGEGNQDIQLENRRTATPSGIYTGPRTAKPTNNAATNASGIVAGRARQTRDQVKASQAVQSEDAQGVQRRRPVAQRPAAGQPQRPATGQAQRPVAGQAQRPAAQGQRPAARQPQRPAAQGQRPAAQAQRSAAGQARPVQGQRLAVQPRQAVGQEQHDVRNGRAPLQLDPHPLQKGVDKLDDLQFDLANTPAYAPDELQKMDVQSQGDPMRRRPGTAATTPRERYEFEEDEIQDEGKGRGNSVLITIVITFLIIGILLAAICLPNWAGIGGGLGNTMGGVKNSVVSVFTNIKSLIMPEEELIKSFSVSAAEGQAPTEVVLAVQTSKNVTGLRVIREDGVQVYNGSYSADQESSEEIINNSNVLLWKPSFVEKNAYSGAYTAYATDKNGEESEGFRSAEIVNIQQGAPTMPPIESFEIDTQEGFVPAAVAFTVVTSTDVTAVRVTDTYSTPIATMYFSDISDETAMVQEDGEYRTWSLYVDVATPYVGDYLVQYQSGDDELSFTDTEFAVQVELTDEPEPTPEPTPEATEAPTATPSPSPSPSPTPAPTATPIPATTALPAADVVGTEDTAPSKLKIKPTLYKNGKTTKSYLRERTINMLFPFTTNIDGDDYALWKQAGVLTYRSGPFRQNASYGTVEVEKKKLTEVWSQDIGGMRVDGGTYFGIGNPGQAVIVKWATEIRAKMGLSEDAKNTTALKEVFVSAMDGKIYSYNLADGSATRDPIDIGAPSYGGLSVATNGTPIIGVGQYNSKLADKKTVANGYHIINLLTNEKEMLVANDGDDRNSNYTGVLGAALFDKLTGTMIFGGMNGVLYTAELGVISKTYSHDTGKITLSENVQGYKMLAGKQDKRRTNIDGSIAMYNNYVYYGDKEGILQCIDINTLTAVWAADTYDSIVSTPALDMEEDGTLALYTANAIVLKSSGAFIRRYDAQTGEQIWEYQVEDVKFNSKEERGFYASPVVGTENISDLVIYTVTIGSKGSAVIALNKADGTVAWSTELPTTTMSSPVAVYNEAGDAWIIQAESDGNIHLMDARSGSIINTLKLEGTIEASPAVYGNLMIIGTSGEETGGVHCIRID